LNNCFVPMSVAGDGHGSVYVGCSGPAIEHWNGVSWDEELLPSGAASAALSYNPDGGFWTVSGNYVNRHP